MFRPPYWFYKNIKFSEEDIAFLSSELSQLSTYGDQNKTSFVFKQQERPEMLFVERYLDIVEDITKSCGIFHLSTFVWSFWSQLYGKGHFHEPHNHASIGSEDFDADISFVHFLDISEQKCFRFTDMLGNVFYPPEQSSGDIIWFPSWVWHEVMPLETDEQRLVVAGNVKFTHFDTLEEFRKTHPLDRNLRNE